MKLSGDSLQPTGIQVMDWCSQFLGSVNRTRNRWNCRESKLKSCAAYGRSRFRLSIVASGRTAGGRRVLWRVG